MSDNTRIISNYLRDSNKQERPPSSAEHLLKDPTGVQYAKKRSESKSPSRGTLPKSFVNGCDCHMRPSSLKSFGDEPQCMPESSNAFRSESDASAPAIY
jgi:hypothetical protein